MYIYIYIYIHIYIVYCIFCSKHCTLRSAYPLVSVAPLNIALIRILTTFY